MTNKLKLSNAIRQLPEINELSKEQIYDNKRTKKDLIELGKKLGLTGLYKLKKAELQSIIWAEISEIKGYLEAENKKKDNAIASLKEAKEYDTFTYPIEPMANEIYSQIQTFLSKEKSFSDIKLRINSVVAKFAGDELKRYENFSTRKDRRNTLKTLLNKTLAIESNLIKSDMELLVDYFYNQLLAFNSTESINDSKEYKKKIKRFNSGSKLTINIEKLILNCLETMTKLESDETIKWTDLTIFLAIGTGRRPVEIHALGTFEYVDDFTLHFSGQAKTRGAEEANLAYNIPTIFPAKLLIKAHILLSETGKRIDPEIQKNDRKAVNRLISAQMSRAMKPYEGIDLYALRAIYADINWELNKDTFIKQGIEKHIKYGEWLGHIGREGQADTTFMSYMKYQIKDFNKVRTQTLLFGNPPSN